MRNDLEFEDVGLNPTRLITVLGKWLNTAEPYDLII